MQTLDPKSVQQYFAGLLSAAGYEVMLADDIEEALSLCELFERATEGQDSLWGSSPSCAGRGRPANPDSSPAVLDTSL